MTKDPLTSIIVPVYNGEKYLCRCLDSILNQTSTDWELLLIDDGSTDQSGVISDEYEARDNRISVFHKENGGLCSARNFGLDHAKGKYILNCDSDDRLAPETVKTCVSYMMQHQLEALQFYSTYIYKDGRETTNELKGMQPGDLTSYVSFGKEVWGIWEWCFLRETINKIRLRFDERIKFVEDRVFEMQLLSHLSHIAVLPERFYFYYENDAGITHNVNYETFLLSLKYYEDCRTTCSPLFTPTINRWVAQYHNELMNKMFIWLFNHEKPVKEIRYLYNLMQPKPEEYHRKYQQLFVRIARTSFSLALVFIWIYGTFVQPSIKH